MKLVFFTTTGGGLPSKMPRPEHLEAQRELPARHGQVIIGSQASIMAGAWGDGARIIPEAKMQAIGRSPQLAPRAEGGHFGSWLAACKGGKPALSNFDYAGPLTETVLLGEVAIHFAGQELQWDTRNMKVTNVEEANGRILGPEPRQGWKL